MYLTVSSNTPPRCTSAVKIYVAELFQRTEQLWHFSVWLACALIAVSGNISINLPETEKPQEWIQSLSYVAKSSDPRAKQHHVSEKCSRDLGRSSYEISAHSCWLMSQSITKNVELINNSLFQTSTWKFSFFQYRKKNEHHMEDQSSRLQPFKNKCRRCLLCSDFTQQSAIHKM